MRPRFPPRAALAMALVASVALGEPAPSEGPPKAAVVLVGATGLTQKEVELILQTAWDEMRSGSGFVLDSSASLVVGGEATLLECDLDQECLLRAAEAAQVEAVVGLRAAPEAKKVVGFELLWAASDARGLARESKVLLHRDPAALEAGVRQGVRKGIPEYARKGLGALTVLAEAGSQIHVDGQSAGTAPMSAPLVLSAGIHRVDIITPRTQRVTRSAEVVEARKAVVDVPSPNEALSALITPAPPPPPAKVLRNASFVVGGVSLAALGGGLFFGIQSMSLNGQLRAGQCASVPCPEGMTQDQAQKLSEQSQGQAVLGNAGLASGLLLGVGAGVMYWLWTREEP